MRRLEDEEKTIPFGRNITGLNIPDEHRRGLVILMSQFKTEAVGFEFDMAGEQIEKRQNGNPEEGQQEHDQRKGRRVGKFAETPAPGKPADGCAAQAVGEPESRQQASGDDR
jgi:hypothetical protein